MNANLSFAHLILQASALAQVVLLLLIAASIVSWAVIFGKRALLARTTKESVKFEERFWAGGNLSDLHEQARRNTEHIGVESIFLAGYEEFVRQQTTGKIEADDVMAAVNRQMRVAHTREVEKLEGGLSLLATIGSTSPYVGLFGTVWGIMSAFISIGQAKQASLATVAPGIAEALIATAMGLFAAIPAVIAYNFFTRGVEQLDTRFQIFSDEMIGIIERGLRAGKQ